MTITQIAAMMQAGDKSPEEKLLLLKKLRAQLMEELHDRQRVLDQVDYMIYELKTGKTGQGPQK